jgi:AraC-like DNA-binding protein
LTGCVKPDNIPPFAKNGVIDLNGYDLCNENINLNGYWEYYPSQFLTPCEIGKNSSAGEIKYSFVPRTWNPGWNLYIPGSGRGFATYRLLIKTDMMANCSPAVRISGIQTSYNLYINGRLARNVGRPGTSVNTTVPHHEDVIIPLPRDEGKYELVLQIANFHAPAGGIRKPVVLGNLSALEQIRARDNLISAFLVSALFLLCLYLLFMFSARRKELEYLYFGIFCFCTMIYSIGLYDTYWSTVLPFLTWPVRYMVMSISVYAGLASIPAYLQRLFPLDVPRGLVYAAFIINGSFAAVMLLIPAEFYALMFPVLHADIAFFILVSVFLILRSAARRRYDAVYVYIGIGIIIVSAVFDILSALKILPFSAETIPWAILIMIILHVSGLTVEFVRLEAQSVYLKADIEKLRSTISERMKSEPGALTVSVEEKINTAIDYLKKNFTEDISRENLAAALDIHPDNFSRYFRQHTGRKYSEYINDLRVKEAIRLLTETDDPVITIAMNVGFNSLRTFNHTFLSITGRTPGDFRK